MFRPRVAAIQLNSQDQIQDNLFQVEALLKQAKDKRADLVVLPENFACFAPGQQAQTALQFDHLKQSLERLAHTYQMWVIGGTLPCPYRPDGSSIQDGRVRSTSLCIDASGNTIARYDKIHLFDVQVGDSIGQYRESAVFEPGDRVVTALTPWGKLGLMICFDLRFPTLTLALRDQGATVLTAPSAFTYATGQLHWELLLRARALDSQSLIIGAAQQGYHAGGRRTWGHAMIVDATAHIRDQVTHEGNGVIVTEFDPVDQQSIRTNMPLFDRRVEIERL